MTEGLQEVVSLSWQYGFDRRDGLVQLTYVRLSSLTSYPLCQPGKANVRVRLERLTYGVSLERLTYGSEVPGLFGSSFGLQLNLVNFDGVIGSWKIQT